MTNPHSMSELIVLVVAYHPPTELLARLSNLKQAGISIAVYDNSPSTAQTLHTLQPDCHFYQANGQNDGLGIAMHSLLNVARDNGFTWGLYVDQDTRFTADSLLWIRNRLLEREGYFAKTAVIQFKAAALTEPASLTRQALLINSGSAFYLPNLSAWGGPDPAFFVECVDYKFCMDAAHAGFELWQQTGCPDFDHESMQPIIKYEWRGRIFNFRPYPWQRHKSFLLGLLRLMRIALSRNQVHYARIFGRNILTHTFTHLRAGLFYTGSKLGVAKKMCSFVIVVFNILML